MTGPLSRALVALALASILSVRPALAEDGGDADVAVVDGESAPFPLVAGALALGSGALALLGGAVALGGGVYLYWSPATFDTGDGRGVLVAQALLVAGGAGLGLGLALAGAGSGLLVSHTFFE